MATFQENLRQVMYDKDDSTLKYLDNGVKAIETSSGGGISNILTKTSNHILELDDAFALIQMNVGSANTVTVPPNSDVAFEVKTEIIISQLGAGQTSIVAGSGVTINSAGDLLDIAEQHAGASLVKVDTNTWNLYGNLA